MSRFFVFSLLIFLVPFTFALPFDICPSQAYLFQSKPVKVYGVNLVTGLTVELEDDTGIGNANINGVGFDFSDRYIYGYDTTNKRLVRLGKDFQAQTLKTKGLPKDHTFYVGDVYEHTYYLYRSGKGLFKVDLSPLDSNSNAQLNVEKITSRANVQLTDFAVHPKDGKIYGVHNSTGYLYQFDKSTGEETAIGNTGITGTFGAGYFDVNGYYYLSRNGDGDIFRIDLSNEETISSGHVMALKFADGPYSNQNDGARCANAAIVDEDSNIDFGDAPDSYKTLLASNGPRHETQSGFYLGEKEGDSEPDGYVSPLNDNILGLSDEDGVGFVTAVEVGEAALISIKASRVGHLSAWIDWNSDGDFSDEGEQVAADTILSAGVNALSISVPSDAQLGLTWSRFRFSEQAGLNYYGGATTGEVEDHPLRITQNGTTLRHFPSENEYATLAFEDNWPKEGDYDLNDLIFRFRITETLNQEDEIVQMTIQGYLAAYGAGYHNGFAFHIPGLHRDAIHAASFQKHNALLQEHNGLETDSNEVIFIVSHDLKEKLPQTCLYYRTAQHCQEAIAFEFEINVYINEGTDTQAVMSMPYDPFMFATPGPYVRDGLWFNPGRNLEVHLSDHAPTEKFDPYWFGWWSDSSNIAINRYFKTSSNHPWALLIKDEWKWPREHVDILDVYPDFAGFAETGGENNTLWYETDKAVVGQYYSPKE